MSSSTHCEDHIGGRKRIYVSKRAAKAAVADVKWLTVYGCPDCGLWHITSKRRARPFWVR